MPKTMRDSQLFSHSINYPHHAGCLGLGLRGGHGCWKMSSQQQVLVATPQSSLLSANNHCRQQKSCENGLCPKQLSVELFRHPHLPLAPLQGAGCIAVHVHTQSRVFLFGILCSLRTKLLSPPQLEHLVRTAACHHLAAHDQPKRQHHCTGLPVGGPVNGEHGAGMARQVAHKLERLNEKLNEC